MKRYNEKASKIVKNVLTGIHDYVKTFAIMTAENPMGKPLTYDNNKERNKDFYRWLKHTRFQFIKISKGKYGNIENPVLILNIPFKILKDFADQYNQESVIYGEILEYGKVNFEYWERNSMGSPLVLKDSIDHFDTFSVKNKKDFYSAMKNWKFTIPFSIFEECIKNWYDEKISILNEEEEKEIKKCINKTVEADETKWTGHHLYKQRGNINYIINMAKRKIKENEKI